MWGLHLPPKVTLYLFQLVSVLIFAKVLKIQRNSFPLQQNSNWWASLLTSVFSRLTSSQWCFFAWFFHRNGKWGCQRGRQYKCNWGYFREEAMMNKETWGEYVKKGPLGRLCHRIIRFTTPYPWILLGQPPPDQVAEEHLSWLSSWVWWYGQQTPPVIFQESMACTSSLLKQCFPDFFHYCLFRHFFLIAPPMKSNTTNIL